MPVAVVTGREGVHMRLSDAHVVRVQMYGTQVDIHGMWGKWPLAQPAVDGSIPKLVFAKELGAPESASECASGGDTSCANFGVGHTCARALDVEQMTLVAELVAGNPDDLAHTSRIRM
jgi:hypothetical protein